LRGRWSKGGEGVTEPVPIVRRKIWVRFPVAELWRHFDLLTLWVGGGKQRENPHREANQRVDNR